MTDAAGSEPPQQPPRMRLTGIHHVTLIVSRLERTTAFYRDLLGIALIEQGVSDDDVDARHFWFGDPDGAAGTLISALEYPDMRPGEVGIGSTHHFALAVESRAELEAWRDYLEGRGVGASAVLDRGRFHSIYLRDPDGHILEIATRC